MVGIDVQKILLVIRSRLKVVHILTRKKPLKFRSFLQSDWRLSCPFQIHHRQSNVNMKHKTGNN